MLDALLDLVRGKSHGFQGVIVFHLQRCRWFISLRSSWTRPHHNPIRINRLMMPAVALAGAYNAVESVFGE
ncbi:MAG: hypothetical protein RBS80_13735 [Thermoguttaceae bacterium]|jgi:hypothetical protein|nr:hypothetical protein [Thermoguttaceae bacterium]